MEKIYHKLVRDKIPEIIKSNKGIPYTRILDSEEFKRELEKKLEEEMREVLSSRGKERVEELADLLEVIIYLGKIENVTLEDIIKIGQEKSTKRGAFDKKIFLEKVEED